MRRSTLHLLTVSTLLLTGVPASTHAQDVVVSPDITISFSNGTVVDDESVVEVTAGPPSVADLGPLPSDVDIEGYHFDSENRRSSRSTSRRPCPTAGAA